MKLNLLPTYVTKGKATRTAVIISILLFLGSIGASIAWTMAADQRLTADKDEMQKMQPRAQATVDTYAYASQVASDPQVKTVMTNTALARAMIAHNAVYPNFYNRFLRYVPPFFRVLTIQAAPIDNQTATVTMTGALQTYQQYADLMLALLRNPDAVSVGRSGYQSNDVVVPPLTVQNQTGTPYKPGEGQLPTDPLERLQYLQSQNFAPRGYTGQGGFGSGQPGSRGAMPGYSIINVTETVKANLQVPDIAGTLSQAGGGGGAAAGAGGGMGGMGGGPPFGMGGGPPMGPMGAGMPGMPPGAMPPGGMGGPGAGRGPAATE